MSADRFAFRGCAYCGAPVFVNRYGCSASLICESCREEAQEEIQEFNRLKRRLEAEADAEAEHSEPTP